MDIAGVALGFSGVMKMLLPLIYIVLFLVVGGVSGYFIWWFRSFDIDVEFLLDADVYATDVAKIKVHRDNFQEVVFRKYRWYSLPTPNYSFMKRSINGRRKIHILRFGDLDSAFIKPDKEILSEIKKALKSKDINKVKEVLGKNQKELMIVPAKATSEIKNNFDKKLLKLWKPTPIDMRNWHVLQHKHSLNKLRFMDILEKYQLVIGAIFIGVVVLIATYFVTQMVTDSSAQVISQATQAVSQCSSGGAPGGF